MLQVVTHSGKFHADDVLAWSLLKEFYPYEMNLNRTRDVAIIEQADIVFDVGGLYEPQNRRFDHHQKEYTGSLSSAGMVLKWLRNNNFISESLAIRLNDRLVAYVDAVDNGIVEIHRSVPDYTTIVDLCNNTANRLEEFDQQFIKASQMTRMIISHIVQEELRQLKASAIVLDAMKQSEANKTNLLELPEYLSWKSSYFENGGTEHHTEFVLFPTLQNTWQMVAIPPTEDSFAQKRSFPESWAGLRDEELSLVTGEDSIFCHKNRFIAVFKTREAAIRSMRKFNLLN